MAHQQAAADSQNAPSLAGVDEIPVEAFYRRINQPNDILLLDVRNESEYETLADGQRFSFGALAIEVLHTPGHTLGQVNFIATDEAGESYAFTGDNVFIQSFGRPDLGGQGEVWAPIVYETIFDKFKNAVEDDTLVLPGHYATFDEADSRGLVAKRAADLWRENAGLLFEDRAAFIDYVLDHLPQMPEQYVEIKRVNIGLTNPDEKTASELELGKNICALTDAYSRKSN